MLLYRIILHSIKLYCSRCGSTCSSHHSFLLFSLVPSPFFSTLLLSSPLFFSPRLVFSSLLSFPPPPSSSLYFSFLLSSPPFRPTLLLFHVFLTIFSHLFSLFLPLLSLIFSHFFFFCYLIFFPRSITLDIMDVNGSGTVDLNSFFELFRLADMHSHYNLSASLSCSSPTSTSTSAAPAAPLISVQPSRKYSSSPLMSPTIATIPAPASALCHGQSVSRLVEKQDSIVASLSHVEGQGQGQSTVLLTDSIRARSPSTQSNITTMISPKPRGGSLLMPIVNVDISAGRHVRTRSLSVQQQSVISAEGEAVFVLAKNSSEGSSCSHANNWQNSLDSSNHGFPSGKMNSMDYSFHGNENLPDDLPEEENPSRTRNPQSPRSIHR